HRLLRVPVQPCRVWIAGQVKENSQKKAGVSLREKSPLPRSNYRSGVPLASGNRAISLGHRILPNERGPDARCVRPLVLIRLVSLNSKALLRHLAADFAARIGCGVDVDIVLAGGEIGGLCVGQRGAALDRARSGIGNRHRDAAVLAGFGGSMEMRGGGGTGEAGIGHLPAQLL